MPALLPARALGALLAVAAVAAIVLSAAAASASAAPVRNCSGAEGGAYRNVTSRNVSCLSANRIAHQLFLRIRPCLRTEIAKAPCSYRWGAWSARGHWITGRFGNDQLDIRATASGGAVVRFQTDWDNE
jgi:hypothetical protein